jgi:hypothetical protein
MNLVDRIRGILAEPRNEWIKISHLQRCCGHYGEPGC